MSVTINFTPPSLRSDNTTPSDPNQVGVCDLAVVPAGTPLPVDPTTLSYSAFVVSGPGASSVTTPQDPAPGNYFVRVTMQDTQNPPQRGGPAYSGMFNVAVPVLPAPGMATNIVVNVQG